MTAWWCVSPEGAVRGFKKCCMSKGMDGTGDDTLWNDCEEGGSVGSECEGDGGTDSEDGDSGKGG
jgi:hypothetical protein